MKALKIAFVAVVLVFFAFGSSYAQSKKTTVCETVPIDYYLWCVDEWVSGELSFCVTTWGNTKVQVKWKGTLEDESGNIYSVSQVSNDNWKPFVPDGPWNGTYTLTMSFELDGMNVATIHYTYHYTLNANGEWTAEVEKEKYECY